MTRYPSRKSDFYIKLFSLKCESKDNKCTKHHFKHLYQILMGGGI